MESISKTPGLGWGSRGFARLSLAGLSLSMGLLLSSPSFSRSPADQRSISLTLQAEATALVRQDVVHLVMAKVLDGSDPQALHAQLTSAIEPAFKQAKAQQTLSVRTGAFRTSPIYGVDGKMTGWRGRAELVIESQDFQAATKMVSALSDQLVLSSIRFHLSEAQRKKQEADLILQAAQAFRERASLTAQAFGFQDFDIEKLELGATASSGSTPPMMLRAASSAAIPKADVVLEADHVPVSVQMSGTVVLR